MENKLYIEYRLYFNPQANQDTLHEMAAEFQNHIYDIWNNDADHGAALDVTDVTYEIVMEVQEPLPFFDLFTKLGETMKDEEGEN